MRLVSHERKAYFSGLIHQYLPYIAKGYAGSFCELYYFY